AVAGCPHDRATAGGARDKRQRAVARNRKISKSATIDLHALEHRRRRPRHRPVSAVEGNRPERVAARKQELAVARYDWVCAVSHDVRLTAFHRMNGYST